MRILSLILAIVIVAFSPLVLADEVPPSLHSEVPLLRYQVGLTVARAASDSIERGTMIEDETIAVMQGYSEMRGGKLLRCDTPGD